MNYSNTYRIPGVFIDPEQKLIRPISITETGVTGFVGFAEKGPLNTAIRIQSFYEFQKIFGGFTEYSYLAFSIHGFFNSGGTECVVVRIAHQNEEEPHNSASKAEMKIKDINNDSLFDISAPHEGTLGNFTQVKIWYDYDDEVEVRKRSNPNDWEEWFTVSNAEEYKVGDVVCVEKYLTKEYTTISKISENTLHMSSKIPFLCDLKKEDVTVSRVFINVMLNNTKEKVYETYNLLSLNKENSLYYIDHINKKSNVAELSLKGEGFLPEEVSFKNLNGGKNGILSITPGDFLGHYHGLDDASGLGIFEGIKDVSLLAIPDLMAFEEIIESDNKQALDNIYTVQRAMIDQCERLDDNRFAILDCPTLPDFIKLMKWRERFDSMFAAMYYPKIEMINPEDRQGLTTIYVPPSGHIAGTYIKCDNEEGVFRAPANKFIHGAVGVNLTVEDEEYEVTYEKGINALQYLPGRGIRIWGARTLSSDVSWRYINVRRTFSMIKNAVKDGSGWAVFEPNTETLRKRIVRHVNAFLLELWKKGYFSGVEPEDGYYILCDEELNPPEEVDAGRINIEIGIAIARPAEFLVVRLVADGEQGGVFSDD